MKKFIFLTRVIVVSLAKGCFGYYLGCPRKY